jgi:hypothetical protein
MPYRKTSKGWYWGSKGPFPTLQKAQAVARAAYASGYKDAENTEANNLSRTRLQQPKGQRLNILQ